MLYAYMYCHSPLGVIFSQAQNMLRRLRELCKKHARLSPFLCVRSISLHSRLLSMYLSQCRLRYCFFTYSGKETLPVMHEPIRGIHYS
uniref:Uncharacterized protein n=1 Tax=Arundo donax TaxID=35708 RepID=A0A0A9G725_ARUDO